MVRDAKGDRTTKDDAATCAIQIELPAVLDLLASRELADKLKGNIGKPVELNAENLMQIATPGIEVLLSATKQWHTDGLGFLVTNISDPLQAAADILGLDPASLTSERPS